MDDVTSFIIKTATKRLHARRVLLFGSRARGDQKPRSDYDFAIDAPGVDHAQWAEFVTGVSEHAPTLLAIDLVHLQSDLDPEFRGRIYEEGVVVFDVDKESTARQRP